MSEYQNKVPLPKQQAEAQQRLDQILHESLCTPLSEADLAELRELKELDMETYHLPCNV